MSVDEEYLQRLMRTVSHDMGGALRVSVGFSKLLMDNYAEELDEKALNWLAMIKADSERMQHRLIALSRYSRLYNVTDRPVPCDLGALCQRALNICAVYKSSPYFSVRAEVLPTIMGYESLWIDLFAELIGNSIKYAGEGADIACRIYYEHENGEVAIIVRDNGSGLTDLQIDMALMPLRGVDAEAGVGMGLPIVKRIAELHGGRLRLLSRAKEIEGLAAMVILPESVLLAEEGSRAI